MYKIIRNMLLFIFLIDIIGAKELEKVSLQLHWKYQFEFAGFITAKEKGFYKDVGLDVELREYKNGLDIENEVLSHKATYGIYNSNILLSYMKNKPIKLLASFFKRSALVIITKPNINSLKDLKNKTIMAGTEDDFRLNFKYLFKEENVDIKDLNFINHTYNIDTFINNKCDAMTAFISDQPYRLDKLNIPYNIIDPSKYGIYNLQLELFTSKNEFDKHLKRTQAFREASIKGWKYALEHQDEIIKIIQKKYNQSLNYEFLKNEARQIELLILPKVYKIGSIDDKFLYKQSEFFYKQKSKYKKLDDFLEIKRSYKHTLFNKKEKEYLNKKKSIKVCYDQSFYPVTYTQNDTMIGISRDIIDIISKKYNINFTYIPSNDWIKQLENLKAGKCDTTAVIITKPNYYDFLEPTISYISDQLVLVTKINEPYFSSLKDIKNKTIGIKYGFRALYKYFKEKYPKLTFIEINTNKFNDILEDKIFGVITISIKSSPLLLRKYNNKLKIMTKVLPDELKGSFGVSIDEPILHSILNKALKYVSRSEIDSIFKNYYNVKVENKTDWKFVFYITVISFIIVVIIIIFLLREKKFNKELEQEVQKAVKKTKMQEQKMIQQSRLAQMGEMINMIAHQWRQPLTAISSTSASINIKAQLNNLDKETTIRLTDDISNYAQHLSSTIDDFRDFFKSTKEKKQTTYNELIESVLNIVEVSIVNKNIILEKNLNSTTLFNTYPNELKQVILNLIKNAEDILIDTKIKNPTIKIETDNNILRISDNGGGVPKNIIDKIFDPYFSTKTQKDGTGLGLYMSKTIIEEHCHGKLSVYNNDIGAIFEIKLDM